MLGTVEAIGLALNLFPVVESLLAFYQSRLSSHDCQFLVKSLKNNRAIFLNSVEELLSAVVSDKAELHRLLEDESCQLWDDALTARLRDHLGSASASDDLFETAKCIFKEADVLRKELYKVGSLTESEPDNKLQKVKRIVKLFVQAPGRHKRANLKNLKYRVEEFRTLTEQGLKLAPSRRTPRTPRKPLLHLLTSQEHARGLHDALRDGWHCDCSRLHLTNLRLEVWPAHPDEDLEDSIRFRFLFSFSPSFQSNSSPLEEAPPLQQRLAAQATEPDLQLSILDDWTVVEIVPILPSGRDRHCSTSSESRAPRTTQSASAKSPGSPATHPSSERPQRSRPTVRFVPNPTPTEDTKSTGDEVEDENTITNLCTFLKGLETNTQSDRRCLGHLTASNGQKYEVFNVTDKVPDGSRILSIHLGDLYSLASRKQPQKSKGKTHKGDDLNKIAPLSTVNRIQLALKLGWSVLQLHSTHWLENYWNKDNILIVFDPTNDYQPYIEHSFQSSRRASVDSNSLTLSRSNNERLTKWVRNETLFTLGIMLIELCYLQPIEELADEDDKDQLHTAMRLERDVGNHLGLKYADAVNACLYAKFGPDCHDTSLGSEEFQLGFYNCVIKPLEGVIASYFAIPNIAVAE